MWSFSKYQDMLETNPGRATRRIFFRLGILVTLMSCAGYFLGWFGEAGKVIQKEFGPEASLKKYEWFKDCAATIEEKASTIRLYEANAESMKNDYGDIPIKEWDHLDKMQYNQWKTETTGVKASYNKVVKEYNAQSSKFNWAMYNVDNLPETFETYLIY